MRLWLPALKRVIRAETLSGALKRSFPRINAGAPTAHLDKSDSQPSLRDSSREVCAPRTAPWATLSRPLRQAQGRLSGPKRWFSSAVLSRRERMRLWLPALKRVIRAETLSGALKRSFPRINAGAPTAHLDKSDSQPTLRDSSREVCAPRTAPWATLSRPLRQAQGRLSGPKRWFSSAVLSRRERMRLWLPALKRVIRAETLSGALKRSFPRINAGAPTAHLDKSDSQPTLRDSSREVCAPRTAPWATLSRPLRQAQGRLSGPKRWFSSAVLSRR